MKKLLLLALVPAIALAQKPPAGCSLLTAAEIAAATGMKVGESHEINMPLRNGQGQMNGCMWKLGEHGMANVSVMQASPSKEQREKGLAGLRQVYEGLKAKGWAVTETKFGDMLCDAATPPAAQSDPSPAMTGCVMGAKGFALSVGIMGPHFKVAPEKVKALADAVAKRLP
jgi:hypothetical protein